MSIEDGLLAWISESARTDQPCPSNQEIADRFNLSSTSTSVTMLQRLERRGLVKVERFHSARRVTVIATGETTRVGKDVKSHWRDRPEHRGAASRPRAPHPAIRQIQSDTPDMAMAIAIEADRRGQPMAAFLSELVAIGWEQHNQMKRAKAA